MATRRGFIGMLAGAVAAVFAPKPLVALAAPEITPVGAVVYELPTTFHPTMQYSDWEYAPFSIDIWKRFDPARSCLGPGYRIRKAQSEAA